MIVLTRVDDRVIHGQTMVRWFAEYPCDGILIIDDELANNEVMAQIYKNVVPPNIKVHIFNLEAALNKVVEAESSAKKYIVIIKSILTFNEMLEKGRLFTHEINIGPCSKRPDTVEIVPTISLDKKEIAAFKNISNFGVKAYFQVVPTSKKVWWADIEKSHKF